MCVGMYRSGVREEVNEVLGGSKVGMVKVLPFKNMFGTSGVVESELTEDVLC